MLPPNPKPNRFGREHVSTVEQTTKKRLFTIRELVDQFGATEWFWRSQIWSGKLPFVQVGRKMFIDRQDIEAFIARHKTRHLA
jgi:excisionase family DNA binding protein